MQQGVTAHTQPFEKMCQTTPPTGRLSWSACICNCCKHQVRPQQVVVHGMTAQLTSNVLFGCLFSWWSFSCCSLLCNFGSSTVTCRQPTRACCRPATSWPTLSLSCTRCSLPHRADELYQANMALQGQGRLVGLNLAACKTEQGEWQQRRPHKSATQPAVCCQLLWLDAHAPLGFSALAWARARAVADFCPLPPPIVADGGGSCLRAV